MKIQQFIKTLNNTEIGKGGTHECYVLVSRKVSGIDKIFDSNNLRPRFLNLKNGGVVDRVHITKGREFRINGLGDFYRANNVNAGDEIIFERRDSEDEVEFFLNLRVKTNIITFQKSSKGIVVLNIDRLSPKLVNGSYSLLANYLGKSSNVIIQFKESLLMRSDSPSKTDFYIITVDGIDVSSDLKNNEYLQLNFSQNFNYLKKIVVWKHYQFETSNNKSSEGESQQRKEQIKKIIVQAIEKNGYVIGSSVKGAIQFLTKNIKDVIPKTGNGPWIQKESFSYEITYRKSFIQLKFVISPGNEHNRKVLSDIAKNIPDGREAKGKDWLVNYIYSLKVNIYDFSPDQDDEIEKLVNKILATNITQIEFFENEVLRKKDEFQY